MHFFRRNDLGFTLIELLLIVAVLGILASIAIPRISGITDKARDAEYQNIAGSIRSAMEIYKTEFKDYPAGPNDNNSGNLAGDLDSWTDLIDADAALGQYVDIDQPNGLGAVDYTPPANAGDDYTLDITNGNTNTIFTITPGDVSTP